MILYNDIKFETQKAYILYRAFIDYVKNTPINFGNYITEKEIEEICDREILKKRNMVLLPVYSFPKWI